MSSGILSNGGHLPVFQMSEGMNCAIEVAHLATEHNVIVEDLPEASQFGAPPPPLVQLREQLRHFLQPVPPCFTMSGSKNPNMAY